MRRTTRLLLWPGFLAVGTTPAFAQELSSDEFALLAFIIILSLGYFVPSMVAFFRRHPNRWPILGINLLFGGTGLGWIGSLIWACGAVHKSPTGNNGGESGLNLFVNDPTIVQVEPPAEPSSGDPGQKLERLKQLFDRGVLTAEEYEGLRRPLVERLVR